MLNACGSVILAGGQSVRMGRDKALLRLHPSGPTIIERVISRLAEADVPPTLVVTNRPDIYRFLGLPMCPDDMPDAGPLGGLLTALRHSPHQCTLVVACDLPCLNPQLLRRLLTLASEGGCDAVVPRWVGPHDKPHVEPLHAVYSPRCIQPLAASVEAGIRKLSEAVQQLNVQYVGEAELCLDDPYLDSFHNINTPHDLAHLQKGQAQATLLAHRR